jgi:hypothetical protein
MMNKIKKLLVNMAKLVVAILVGTSIYRMFISKDKTKTLVNLVWNNIQDDLVKELGLPRVPEIQFCTLDTAIACTEVTCTYQGLFEKEIISTKSDFVIRVDADKVATLINSYKLLVMKPSGIEKAVIQQILAHESRHIWQANGDFYIGTKVPMFDTNFLSGYGLKREELDANQFAVDFARNDKERIVALHFKTCQENAGSLPNTLHLSSKEQRELAKRIREVYSK